MTSRYAIRATAPSPLSSRCRPGLTRVRHLKLPAARCGGTWAEADARAELLRALLDRLHASQTELAQLQCTETGVSPEDSLHAVSATLAVALGAAARRGRCSRTTPGSVRARPVLGPAVH